MVDLTQRMIEMKVALQSAAVPVAIDSQVQNAEGLLDEFLEVVEGINFA
jgi:hypothetical protein